MSGIRVKGGTTFRGAGGGVLVAESALIPSIFGSAGAGAGLSTDYESPECRAHKDLRLALLFIFICVPNIFGFLFFGHFWVKQIYPTPVLGLVIDNISS